MQNFSNLSEQIARFFQIDSQSVVDITFVKSRDFEQFITEGRRLISWGFAANSEPNAAFSFNHKSSSGDYRSLSEFAMKMDRKSLGLLAPYIFESNEFSGEGSRPKTTILVEDASPDSCLAFLILFARATNTFDANQFDLWVEHISRWELFGYDSGPNLALSYGALHNALVHSYIASDAMAAWFYGLSFLMEQFKHNTDPRSLNADLLTMPYGRMAQSAFKFEEASYEALIENSEAIQLRVPSGVDPERKLLIDALICSEDHFHFGTHKALLRTDNKRAELKSGFGFMALFRSDLAGTGNDITISTDAYRHLSLKPLWDRIEQLENEAWEGNRPSGEPRRGMDYAFGEKPVSDQPWYIDRLFSLIAAPMDPYRTKLRFKQVIEAIWQAYHPLRDVCISPMTTEDGRVATSQESVEIEKIKPLPIPHGWSQSYVNDARTPRLFAACWNRESNASPNLINCSTIGRILCAKIQREPNLSGPILFQELPPSDSFEILEVKGTMIVICEQGAFFLLRNQSSNFDCDEFVDEYWRICSLRLVLEENLQQVRQSIKDAKAMMEGKRSGRVKKFTELFSALANGELSILSELSNIKIRRSNPSLILFREKLMFHWGIDEMVNDVARALSEFKNMITVQTDLISNRRLAALTRYGFPLVFFAGFFEFVVNPEKVQSLSPMQWLDALHLPGLVFYFSLSVLGVLFVWAVQKFASQNNRLIGQKKAIAPKSRRLRY